jgi:hypothetical protein
MEDSMTQTNGEGMLVPLTPASPGATESSGIDAGSAQPEGAQAPAPEAWAVDAPPNQGLMPLPPIQPVADLGPQ